jgi:hypothetical protein
VKSSITAPEFQPSKAANFPARIAKGRDGCLSLQSPESAQQQIFVCLNIAPLGLSFGTKNLFRQYWQQRLIREIRLDF